MMESFTTLQTIGIVLAVISVLGVCLYNAGRPKPLPGIPYNPVSAKRFLGDGPDLFKWAAEHGSPYGYLPEMIKKLDSPIVQLFLRPFARPWIIVADPYEAHDVRTRRFKEFDRSNFFGEMFVTLLPKMHVHMPTGEEWKSHRKLIADTMSPTFLSSVAGPQMWESTQNIIALWRRKAELAQGRPFDANKDVFKGALDIVVAATFGEECGSARAQLAALKDTKIDLPSDEDIEIIFPKARDPPDFESIETLTTSLDIPVSSLFPKLAHRFALNFYPSLISAGRAKDTMLKTKLDEAHQKFSKKPEDIDIESFRHMTSALELLVARETQMAAKEDRKAEYNTQAVRDELFGFLLGGFETTSTAITWILKFLTQDQAAQTKLRSALRSQYKRAVEAGDSPTISEISATNIPYLEAVMDEGGRVGLTALASIRVATEDTQLMGYPVPKGTDVFFINNGPSVVMPSLKSSGEKRSKGGPASREKLGSWDDEDIQIFKPERWLFRNEKTGEVEFNSLAGPSHPFGGGPRGCFGKKWAQLEMRVILTLMFFHFELLPTPEKYSSMAAIDGITHRPATCYVRLKAI
ncbi:Cytochrome P450 monooxygenase [Pseudocercospora fuligena]|uniref:Cytochrome P450 monooxygenase n=1 Tax=Pseudocercospora fuligena TaxID=685502 RepID=A0A8H6RM45_9PEZI|nr:Cytochrome P450 monooxygenase [Pseudocercospora fuligena]